MSRRPHHLLCLLPLFAGLAGCHTSRPVAVPAASASAPAAIATATELSALSERIAPRCQAATVGLFQNGGAGSGVIVSPDGLIMTATHVIQQTTDASGYILVSLADGRVAAARPLGSDAFQDIALARLTGPVPKGGWPYAPVGDSAKIKIGDWLIATGNSRGIETDRPAPVRLGRLGAVTKVGDQVCLVSDCAVVSGDSGGPLFNLQGEVIGIHSHVGKSTDENFHVPSAQYQAVWNELLAGRQLSVTADKLPEAERKTVQGILHHDFPHANDKELAELLSYALYNSKTKQMRLGVPANLASKLDSYKTGKSLTKPPMPEEIAQSVREQLRQQYAKITPEMIESVLKSAVTYTLADGKASVKVELTPAMEKALRDGDAQALAKELSSKTAPVLPDAVAKATREQLRQKYPKATPEMLESVLKNAVTCTVTDGKASVKVGLTPAMEKALAEGDAQALAKEMNGKITPALPEAVAKATREQLRQKYPKATPEMLESVLQTAVKYTLVNGQASVKVELTPEMEKALAEGDAQALAAAADKAKAMVPGTIAKEVREDLRKKYPKATPEVIEEVVKSAVRYTVKDGKTEIKVELTPEMNARLNGEAPFKILSRRDNDEIKMMFRPILARLNDCVVEIRGDDQKLCLGAVVGPDGLIATKASELKGKLTICHDGTFSVPAIIVGKDDEIDLALLRPESPVPSLKAPAWAPADAMLGQVMLIPDARENFLSMAAASVRERPIDRLSHAIGSGRTGVLNLLTQKDYTGPGVLIEKAVEKTAAERAGIRPGDLVVAIDGTVIHNLADVNRLLINHKPGDKMKLRILRDGELKTISFEMGKANNDTRLIQPHDGINNDQDLSLRYAPFAMAFQHDGQITARDCGGPILDLQGRIIGLNIARLNRVATLAIPADTLQERIDRLLKAPKAP
jgi:S1-C subfamily serine protease